MDTGELEAAVQAWVRSTPKEWSRNGKAATLLEPVRSSPGGLR